MGAWLLKYIIYAMLSFLINILRSSAAVGCDVATFDLP